MSKSNDLLEREKLNLPKADNLTDATELVQKVSQSGLERAPERAVASAIEDFLSAKAHAHAQHNDLTNSASPVSALASASNHATVTNSPVAAASQDGVMPTSISHDPNPFDTLIHTNEALAAQHAGSPIAAIDAAPSLAAPAVFNAINDAAAQSAKNATVHSISAKSAREHNNEQDLRASEQAPTTHDLQSLERDRLNAIAATLANLEESSIARGAFNALLNKDNKPYSNGSINSSNSSSNSNSQAGNDLAIKQALERDLLAQAAKEAATLSHGATVAQESFKVEGAASQRLVEALDSFPLFDGEGSQNLYQQHEHNHADNAPQDKSPANTSGAQTTTHALNSSGAQDESKNSSSSKIQSLSSAAHGTVTRADGTANCAPVYEPSAAVKTIKATVSDPAKSVINLISKVKLEPPTKEAHESAHAIAERLIAQVKDREQAKSQQAAEALDALLESRNRALEAKRASKTGSSIFEQQAKSNAALQEQYHIEAVQEARHALEHSSEYEVDNTQPSKEAESFINQLTHDAHLNCNYVLEDEAFIEAASLASQATSNAHANTAGSAAAPGSQSTHQRAQKATLSFEALAEALDDKVASSSYAQMMAQHEGTLSSGSDCLDRGECDLLSISATTSNDLYEGQIYHSNYSTAARLNTLSTVDGKQQVVLTPQERYHHFRVTDAKKESDLSKGELITDFVSQDLLGLRSQAKKFVQGHQQVSHDPRAEYLSALQFLQLNRMMKITESMETRSHFIFETPPQLRDYQSLFKPAQAKAQAQNQDQSQNQTQDQDKSQSKVNSQTNSANISNAQGSSLNQATVSSPSDVDVLDVREDLVLQAEAKARELVDEVAYNDALANSLAPKRAHDRSHEEGVKGTSLSQSHAAQASDRSDSKSEAYSEHDSSKQDSSSLNSSDSEALDSKLSQELSGLGSLSAFEDKKSAQNGNGSYAANTAKSDDFYERDESDDYDELADNDLIGAHLTKRMLEREEALLDQGSFNEDLYAVHAQIKAKKEAAAKAKAKLANKDAALASASANDASSASASFAPVVEESVAQDGTGNLQNHRLTRALALNSAVADLDEVAKKDNYAFAQWDLQIGQTARLSDFYGAAARSAQPNATHDSSVDPRELKALKTLELKERLESLNNIQISDLELYAEGHDYEAAHYQQVTAVEKQAKARNLEQERPNLHQSANGNADSLSHNSGEPKATGSLQKLNKHELSAHELAGTIAHEDLPYELHGHVIKPYYENVLGQSLNSSLGTSSSQDLALDSNSAESFNRNGANSSANSSLNNSSSANANANAAANAGSANGSLASDNQYAQAELNKLKVHSNLAASEYEKLSCAAHSKLEQSSYALAGYKDNLALEDRIAALEKLTASHRKVVPFGNKDISEPSQEAVERARLALDKAQIILDDISSHNAHEIVQSLTEIGKSQESASYVYDGLDQQEQLGLNISAYAAAHDHADTQEQAHEHAATNSAFAVTSSSANNGSKDSKSKDHESQADLEERNAYFAALNAAKEGKACRVYPSSSHSSHASIHPMAAASAPHGMSSIVVKEANDASDKFDHMNLEGSSASGISGAQGAAFAHALDSENANASANSYAANAHAQNQIGHAGNECDFNIEQVLAKLKRHLDESKQVETVSAKGFTTAYGKDEAIDGLKAHAQTNANEDLELSTADLAALEKMASEVGLDFKALSHEQQAIFLAGLAASQRNLKSSNALVAATASSYAATQHSISNDAQVKKLREALVNIEHSIHVLVGLVDCGMLVQAIGDNFDREVLWANQAFTDITGYDAEMISNITSEDFARYILHPDDVNKFFRDFDKSQTLCSNFVVEYRALHAITHQYVWCRLHSAYMGSAGGRALFLCMMEDITEDKKQKDKTELWIRKNELLSEACQEYIFEYDINTDTLERYGNYRGLSHENNRIKADYLKVLHTLPYVHEEDKDIFRNILLDKSLALGNKRRTVKMRIKPVGAEEFLWHACSAIGYTEESTGHTKIIGKIHSIHQYESKIRSLNLETQLDPMTKLLNKVAMQSLSRKLIEENPTQRNAMLMIDIDNFKRVNDTQGHAFGDEVIRMVAHCLSNAFRSSDLVARMGGDEFMVVLKKVTKEQAVSLGELYLNLLAQQCAHLSVPYKVTSSVGIAFTPDDAATYEELFACADAALYEVKNRQKGMVATYSKNGPLELNSKHDTSALNNTTARIEKTSARIKAAIDRDNMPPI